MCGIVGYLDISYRLTATDHQAVVRKMSDKITHRGPDDFGTWIDEESGIALGHRRLSIIDLSSEGHQPMTSSCGRYVIVFNGEIYNYLELKKEFEEHFGEIRWRGHSDTEILLELISRYGLEKTITMINGMFAFALWDKKDLVLHLARDRLGEKPLYYGWKNDVFFFSSELKALKAHPRWEGEIDRDSLALFMRYNCIPAPYSIYRDINKLLPAQVLSMPLSSARKDRSYKLWYYWSAKDVVQKAVSNAIPSDEIEAANELEKLLGDAVKIRMCADVPLGAFLSGGIDSSTIVSLMQAQSNVPIRTFSIGFYEDAYNEASYAKEVARHLKTDHTELYVTPDEAMSVIPRLPALYDEPFADSSQIPTFLVSQLARRYVTVSLSGDGGDELFGGYNRYFWGTYIWKKIGWMPSGIRKSLSSVLSTLSTSKLDNFFSRALSKLPLKIDGGNISYKLQKLSEILPVESRDDMYLRLLSHWKQPSSVVLGSIEPMILSHDSYYSTNLSNYIDRMMYIDMINYLPNDILVKVDRASMAVSLEGRIPFLDHRVVEFAWRLPQSLKIRNGNGKWLLREILYKHVPRQLIERPKKGFGVPIDQWLRGPLRGWAEDLLSESRLRSEAYFNPDPIRKKWDEHVSGKNNWQYYLWDVLMFQAWQYAQ